MTEDDAAGDRNTAKGTGARNGTGATHRARSARQSSLSHLDGPAPSLRDQVAAQLRHALIAGDFTPGEVLSAPTLAAEFGVSPTPVREAMLDLANEGHVSPIRYKGYRVTEVSAETRRQVLQLRSLIEIPLMVEIAHRGLSADLIESSLTLAQSTVEAAAQGDLVRFIGLDMELHLGLLRAAGNDIAVRHVRSLRAMTRLTGLKDLAAENQLVETAKEHLEIVEAARQGQADRMQHVMMRHLGHVTGVWAGHSETPDEPIRP